MKKNRMKEKLRRGDAVFGVSVMIPSPQIVEMVAAAGFDWVLLDCEHGTLTLESVERARFPGRRSTFSRCSTAA